MSSGNRHPTSIAETLLLSSVAGAKFCGNVGISRDKGTLLWNFASNSGLRKFRHGKLIVLSTKLFDG